MKEELEFTVRYKTFILFIYETIESEGIISYLGECKELNYRWRQEGKLGFFRLVKNFKYEVNKHLGKKP